MCFGRAFHLILMHFVHKIQCFEEFLQYFALFFKNLFFHKILAWLCVFRSIESVFRSIEIAFKISWLVLCVSIDRILFLINRKSYGEFLKHLILTCSNTFSKCFQTLSLFIRSVKAPIKIFCRFPLFFLQGFSPLRPVRPFYPSFCIYFHVSCIKSCIYGEISNL